MVAARLVLFCVVFAACAANPIRAFADDNDEALWSQSVDGLQARISFQHERVFNGTPMVATYLHLRNTSNMNSPIKFCWRPMKASFRTTDAAGKDVPRGIEYSGPRPQDLDVIIPYDGTLSFNISGSGLGIPGDMVAALDLGSGSCIISPDLGQCSLQLVIEIPDDKEKHDGPRSWHGRLELPAVAIPIKVEQPDPAKAAELIRRLGQAMVTPSEESDRAARVLSLIDDDRVVPWYVKAMSTKDYDRKFNAIDRLSRFKGDEAFRA